MFLFINFLLMAVFLLGTAFLTALVSAFRRIHKKDTQKIIHSAGSSFFYHPIHRYFFPGHEYEGLYFATICAQYLCRCCFIASMVVFFLGTPLFKHTQGMIVSTIPQNHEFTIFWMILAILVTLFVSFIITDYFPRIIGLQIPEKVIRFCTPFASIFMVLAFPITYAFLKLSESFSRTVYYDNLQEPEMAKQEIIDILHDSDVIEKINRHDKEIIESVFSFGQRIAREVMVPRVNLFAIPSSLTIREAAKLISSERYSRIPLYRNTIDEIDGMVMYKDILAKFMEYAEKSNDPAILDAPVDSIRKNVLYTPETKKISNLLQEFRKKHVHFAIVVDEYGGTEGIVTIEDILEEIVGEISDEYDEHELMYTHQPDGSWIVDARMSIFDVEELLDIDIPQEGDYDTIGGYVFHCAGAIPSPGFTIHQDQFEAEVLSSNERSIEKIRIKPESTLEKEPHQK